MANLSFHKWRTAACAAGIAAVAATSGCSVVTPISQFDAGVAELCQEGKQSYSHQDYDRYFTVVMIDDPDQLATQCGPAAAACTDGFTVWVPNDASCPSHMAHELNHVFGMHFVDAGSAANQGQDRMYAHTHKH